MERYMYYVILFLLCLSNTQEADFRCPPKKRYDLEVLYQWTTLEYKWPPFANKQELQRRGLLIPENNAMFSMDVFHGQVFVNVGRGTPASKYRDATGVPSTLNRIVIHNGRPVLDPWPSLGAQKIGDCNAIQNIGALKIDKAAGMLWAVDMGTVNKFPLCPSKLVIFNIRSGGLVRNHIFSTTVLSNVGGFITDIAFVKEKGRIRYAVMTDVMGYKLVVYDFIDDRSWFVKDKSMQFETCGSRFVSGDSALQTVGGIRTVTVSPDSMYIYYSPVGGYIVYQMSVKALQHPGKQCEKYIRTIGELPLQTNFMVTGKTRVYYSEVARNAIKVWNCARDVRKCQLEEKVKVESIETIIRSEDYMPFINSMALDDGYLYFMSNNMGEQRLRTIDFDNPCKPNFIIGRVFVKGFVWFPVCIC